MIIELYGVGAFTNCSKQGELYSNKLERVTIIGYDNYKFVTIRRGTCLSNFPEKIERGYVYRTRRRVPFKHETLSRIFNNGD